MQSYTCLLEVQLFVVIEARFTLESKELQQWVGSGNDQPHILGEPENASTVVDKDPEAEHKPTPNTETEVTIPNVTVELPQTQDDEESFDSSTSSEGW